MSTETTNKKIKIDNGTTFGRTYTDKAIDAKLPTDLIASANKLSLGAGSTALGNGVNLDGFTYDVTTNTLNASGGKLPDGTRNNPFKLQYFDVYGYDYEIDFVRSSSYQFYISVNTDFTLSGTTYTSTPDVSISCSGTNNALTLLTIHGRANKQVRYNVRHNNSENYIYIPALADPSADGSYTLQITKTGTAYHYDWVAGVYNHYIVISDGTASNAIYLLIPSTNSLICSSLPELNTLLGTTNRFIQASGVVTDTASKLPIVAINWQGSFSSSKIITMSSEETTTKFTNVVDVVTTL